MKKVLFATTALVASTGFAAADVTISGSANMGFKHVETAIANDEENSINHEIDVNVSMSGTTDAGLSFGAAIGIVDNNAAPLAADRDGTVFISGDWGKITIGDPGDADVQGGIATPGYDDIGIDDLAESLDGTGDSTFKYSHTVGALSFAVSTAITATGTEEFAVGAKYSANGMYVGLGYSDNNLVAGNVTTTDGETTSVYVGGTIAGMKLDAMYSSLDAETNVATDDREVYGLSAVYTVGALSVTVAWSDTDVAATGSSQGVGFAYNLGGGATLAGGIGEVNNLSRADLGVTFSF